MIVRTVIIAVLSVYAFTLTLRHNLHMLQLNGYKNDEHLRWIKKNLRQQWLLIFGFFSGILRLFLPYIIPDILIILDLIMIILVYRALMRLNNKKKLVYTPRIKRLIFTLTLLSILIIAGIVYVSGIKGISAASVLVVSLELILDIAGNCINHPVEEGINRYYINDARRILRSMPELITIGVTGSYGKTSVKYFLETLLKAKYNVLVTPGNFNTPLGITRTIREHMKPSNEIFICEMGARRTGEIKEICDLFPPDHGIITAVGPQHLETFFSIENIRKTKFELADAVSGKGMLFLNGDNELIREAAEKYPSPVLYYSNGQREGYYAKDIKVSDLGTSFTVVTPEGEEELFHVRLIGAHNIINVMGAIAAANKLGISLRELKVPVRRIEPVEHRMQIRNQGNVTIIDDAYNSNPVGSKAAVETLAMFDGVKILITPGMVELGEKEEEYNRKFGTYAAENCDYIFLVGKNHTKPIMDGIMEKNFPEERCRVFDRVEDAMSFALGIRDDRRKFILLENDLPDNY